MFLDTYDNLTDVRTIPGTTSLRKTKANYLLRQLHLWLLPTRTTAPITITPVSSLRTIIPFALTTTTPTEKIIIELSKLYMRDKFRLALGLGIELVHGKSKARVRVRFMVRVRNRFRGMG